MKNSRFFFVVFLPFFFFKLIAKFSDFMNSDDYIGKITSNLSEYIQILLKNKIKKWNISNEKMRNWEKMRKHSFFGKDFWSKPLCWFMRTIHPYSYISIYTNEWYEWRQQSHMQNAKHCNGAREFNYDIKGNPATCAGKLKLPAREGINTKRVYYMLFILLFNLLFYIIIYILF